MPKEFKKQVALFGGEIKWTAKSAAVCVEGQGEKFASRILLPNEKPLVAARVIRPGLARFLEHHRDKFQMFAQEYSGYTFTGISQHGSRALSAYVKTKSLRKLSTGVEVVPVEVALANLSLWAETTEECVGCYWSDGIQALQVVTKDSALWLTDESEIRRVASEIPWVDHSDPGVAPPLGSGLHSIAGSCGFTGGAALAVGAAASAAYGCGGFVNPKPQTIIRDGVLTMTMPNRQITI